MLDNTKFCFLTCKRKVPYLPYTLDSFFGDPKIKGRTVQIVEDSVEPIHTEMRSSSNLCFENLSLEEASLLEGKGPHTRFRLNYNKCLKTYLDPEDHGLLIMDDDLEFREGWVEKLSNCLKEMDQLVGDNYVLTLYSNRIFEGKKNLWIPNASYCCSHTPGFIGMICLYFTKKALHRFRSVFSEKVINAKKFAPADIQLGKHFRNTTKPPHLYAVIRSLVQHKGVSSELSGGHAYSSTYHLPWKIFDQNAFSKSCKVVLNKESRLIFGCSAGGLVDQKLHEILCQDIENFFVTNGTKPKSWVPTDDLSLDLFYRRNSAYSGDISHWWIQYAPKIIKDHHNSRFICLLSSLGKMKEHLLDKLKGFARNVNPFSDKSLFVEIKNKCEKRSYPSYKGSLEESAEKFCKEYSKICKEMQRKYPNHVKIFSYEDVSSGNEILNWVKSDRT